MLLVAHRTPSSRSACEQLARAGARVFEADVQIDAGDRVVVSHYLPFGRAGLLQRDNWRIRWHSRAPGDPELTAVAALVPNECLVLLDLKEKAAARRARLVAALAAAPGPRDRFRVCGPFPEDLERLRAAGYRTWRTVDSARQLGAVLRGGRLPDEAVTIRHSLLTEDAVRRLHAQVPTVVAWTVNSPARARRLRSLGVDGVTTDRAAVLRLLGAAPN